MKRITAFLLCFVLSVGLILSLPAVADEEEELPPVYVKFHLDENNDYLTFELYTDGLLWTALDFGVKYDPAALSLESVAVGRKIQTAISRGFDFITTHRDIDAANQVGYCNFVAAVGSADCRMTAYSGPFAIYTFSVKDLTKATASLGLCISTLVDKNGEPLLEYTAFGPSEAPVVYQDESVDLFTYGDLNRNGVDMYDALLIMQSLVDIVELDEYQTEASKVSGGESVSMYDALLIMQYLVDIIEKFPVEE